MAEVVKLLICLVLVFLEVGQDRKRLVQALHRTIIQNYVDTFKICIPSLVYVVQNNLLYVSASHLDAATYQVCRWCEIIKVNLICAIQLIFVSRSHIN